MNAGGCFEEGGQGPGWGIQRAGREKEEEEEDQLEFDWRRALGGVIEEAL